MGFAKQCNKVQKTRYYTSILTILRHFYFLKLDVFYKTPFVEAITIL